ncbi:hypothetical protein H4S07_004296 [Coemansia furcata]|uniref:Uncharacterized protein n=1 Tax=Coemansia furcata TaxID=417177 RepID=A0ACC1LAB8_9FUNG|nr:hypothetical protein H4S07_004296 [Coemansia furcata]
MRDKKLAGLLSCPPETQCEAVERLVKQGKASLKTLKSLRGQLAPLVAQDLCNQLVTQGEIQCQNTAYHCEDGDGPFASSVGSELAKLMAGINTKWLAVVASGPKVDGGALVVVGNDEAIIIDAVERLKLLLGTCKGGISHGTWRGKAASFSQLAKLNISAQSLALDSSNVL